MEYSIVVAKRLIVVVERLAIAAEYSYSLTTLSSILTTGVALGSRKRADKVVGAPARKKATVGAIVRAVSLL